MTVVLAGSGREWQQQEGRLANGSSGDALRLHSRLAVPMTEKQRWRADNSVTANTATKTTVTATARRRTSGVPVVLFSALGSAPSVSGLRQMSWGVVVAFVPGLAHFTLRPVPRGMT